MGFLEVLTLIFIVLKLSNIIDWSWVFVLLPLYISLVIYAIIVMFLGGIAILLKLLKRK